MAAEAAAEAHQAAHLAAHLAVHQVYLAADQLSRNALSTDS